MSRPATLAMAALLLAAGTAGADVLQPRAPDFAAKYKAFTLILGPTRRCVYGTYRGTLHLLETRQGVLVEKLTRDLWSPVVKMVAVDLNGDRQDELVGYTRDSRLFVLSGTDLQEIWSTQQGRFKDIKALTVGDVDSDGKPEIVMIADGLLRIFNSLHDIEIWKSTESYTDTDIAIGDVDGDSKPEIVLNQGLVLGATFRDLKWKYEPGFGTEIDLFDIDNDGKLEIIALGTDGLMRVFDVDERRVKWN